MSLIVERKVFMKTIVEKKYSTVHRRCRRKKMKCNLSRSFIRELLLKPICSNCGISCNIVADPTGHKEEDFTIERKNPLLGYITSNVEVLCNKCNCIKSVSDREIHLLFRANQQWSEYEQDGYGDSIPCIAVKNSKFQPQLIKEWNEIVEERKRKAEEEREKLRLQYDAQRIERAKVNLTKVKKANKENLVKAKSHAQIEKERHERFAKREETRAEYKKRIEEAIKNHKPNVGSFANLPDDVYPWLKAGNNGY